MKIRHLKRHEAEVDAAALTDIMFFLLFFFLILSTMTTLNVIKIQEPQSTAQTVSEKDFGTVTIDKGLNYYVGTDRVSEDSLYASIKTEMLKHKNNLLVLRIETGVPVDYLVKVLDIGLKEKLKVTLETQKLN